MSTARLGAALRQIQTLFDGPGTIAGLTDAQLLERFVARRDDSAFAAIVARHGTTVLAACRGILRDPNDAEDAFQATFVVLARKAGSIWVGDSLACWLYKVARRVAAQANRDIARRRAVERRAAAMSVPTGPIAWDGWDDRRALHEELGRLPAKYRAPILLCDLEDLTRNEAAARLGWTPGTVASRLSRGRALLRDRLARRGLAPAGGVAGLLLACRAEAALAPALVASTVKIAVCGAAPALATAAALGARASKASLAVKIVGPATIALAACFGIAWKTGAEGPEGSPAAHPRAPEPKPVAVARPADPAATVPVSGRVVEKAGKPIPDVRVDVIARRRRQPGDIGESRKFEILGSTTADADGRYRLDVRRTSSARDEHVYVMATAPGRGMDGRQDIDVDATRIEADLRMGPERPIRGRLIDLEGRPIAGVRLRATLAAGLFGFGLQDLDIPWDGWPKPITTDAEGRFAVPGMGDQSAVTLEADDDRFGPEELRFEQDEQGRASEKTFVLGPARVIEARVIYADGRPAAGAPVVVRGTDKRGMLGRDAEARADARGVARVRIWPGVRYDLSASPPAGEPFLGRDIGLDWPDGARRVEKEVTLPRGVVVRGKLVESPSGRPVAGARITYYQTYRDNPLYTAHTGLRAASGPDGTFAMVLPRGPGDLLVSGPTPDYLHIRTNARRLGSGTQPNMTMYPDAMEHIDIKPETPAPEVALKLRRGASAPCHVVGPDGAPVPRAIAFGRSYSPELDCWNPLVSANGGPPTLPVRDGRLVVPGLDPEAPSTIYVIDPERRLGATVELSGASAEDGPATIRLAPCGSARARLVGKDGKPRANQRPPWFFSQDALALVVSPGEPYRSLDASRDADLADLAYQLNLSGQRYDDSRSDAEGVFTYTCLIPGALYRFRGQEFTAESGRTIDLPEAVVDGD